MDNLTYGNPAAHRVRVLYLNADATTVAQGMPLCYKYDTTTNWAGGSVSDGTVTESTTLTAGSPTTAQAKYIEVEDPDITNLEWFAGIVAPGGWCGKAGTNIVLDIYVPNGAIVPVLTVLTSTTVGRTILAVMSDTSTLGSPTTDMPRYSGTTGTIASRSVAVAEETITAAGLVLAKLDPTMFTNQGGQVSQELEVEAGAVGVTVNKINIKFSNTTGNQEVLHYRATLSGTGGSARQGVYRFETFVTGAQADWVHGLDTSIDLDGTITGGAFVTPLCVGVYSYNRGTVDLSGVQMLSAIQIYWFVGDSGGTLAGEPNYSTIFYINALSSGTLPDCFIYSAKTALGGYNVVANDVTFSDTSDVAIPIILDGVTYILVAFADLGTA